MTALKGVRGVQKLVGVCPERLMIATEYGGPVLCSWMGRISPLLPRQWIDIASEIALIFADIHALGFIHNDIKSNNICLDVTPNGLDVTVIDFGLSERRGEYLDLLGAWREDKLLAAGVLHTGRRALQTAVGRLRDRETHGIDLQARTAGDARADHVDAREPEARGRGAPLSGPPPEGSEGRAGADEASAEVIEL